MTKLKIQFEPQQCRFFWGDKPVARLTPAIGGDPIEFRILADAIAAGLKTNISKDANPDRDSRGPRGR